MKYRSALASLVLLSLWVVAPVQAGCAILSTDQNMQRSDVIFSGEVTTIEPTRVFDRGFGWIGGDGVTFNVVEAWKGVDTATVTLTSPSHSEGYQFQQGQQYLVYAYHDGSTLITDGCTGTKPLADAQGELEVLGSGSVPLQPSTDEHEEAVTSSGTNGQQLASDTRTATPLMLAIGSILVISTIGIGVVLRQRRAQV